MSAASQQPDASCEAAVCCPHEPVFKLRPLAEEGWAAFAAPRTFFYRLLNADDDSEVLRPAFALASSAFEGQEADGDQLAPWPKEAADLDAYLSDVEALRRTERAHLAGQVASISRESVLGLLSVLAPTALLDGHWLQKSSSMAFSHTEVGVRLLDLYMHEIGDDALASNHPNLARLLLRSADLEFPEVATWSFSQLSAIPDSAYQAVLPTLCASLFPRRFLPELLGFSLFSYVAGICPLYLALLPRLRAEGRDVRFLERHEPGPRLSGRAQRAREAIERFLLVAMEQHGPGEAEEMWRRVGRGFRAGLEAERPLRERWDALTTSSAPTVEQRVYDLIRRKAPFGHGFHRKRVLGGERIDALLAEASDHPERVLDRLARSRHIKPGNADASGFFTRLVAFGGPMFAVFSPEELATLREWISALPGPQKREGVARDLTVDRAPMHSSSARRADREPPTKTTRAIARSNRRRRGASLRELYYQLVNVDIYPEVLGAARDFAHECLRRAAKHASVRDRPLELRHYSHQGLMAWHERTYREQVDSYRPLRGEPRRTRALVVAELVQRTPLILVEGAWLQNVALAGTNHLPIASKLMHICWDELGNGRTFWHHANVWRRMMAQLGEHFPPSHTREFAYCDAFIDAAFDYPVYTLAIGQFPKEFLPETLGLNLAIERSLLGGVLMQQVDVLRYHGIDPTHPLLHNTIDNPSSGHSLHALEVVRLFMDDVRARGGDAAVQSQWERVWTGYQTTWVIPQVYGLEFVLRYRSALWDAGRREVARRLRPSASAMRRKAS